MLGRDQLSGCCRDKKIKSRWVAAPSGEVEAMLVEQLASSKAGTGTEESGRGEEQKEEENKRELVLDRVGPSGRLQ